MVLITSQLNGWLPAFQMNTVPDTSNTFILNTMAEGAETTKTAVHIINYINIVQCAKTVQPARHNSMNGRVASNVYPIPYIYHSFALSEMQRTQPISHTMQYPQLSCTMFWLDIRLFLEPCQCIISCASKQLCVSARQT